MIEFDGITQVVDELEPHWDVIESYFEHERRRFENLIAREHDHIGRILKCHLIVEHYLERFLVDDLGLTQLRDARLSFHQKAVLLPEKGSQVTWIKPGILELNTVRNRLAHRLDADLEETELSNITAILGIARRGKSYATVTEKVEAFTPIACTFLLPTLKELKRIFARAFSHIRLRTYGQ